MYHDGKPISSEPPCKSKGEIQIARLLDREGMAFRYEHPLAVIDRGNTKIWYPDFSLSRYGMIIEYFGLNNDPGYRRRSEHKMQVYRDNGIDGIFLTEESFKGDWPTRIMAEIESVLTARMDKFYSCRQSARAPAGRYDGLDQYNSASL